MGFWTILLLIIAVIFAIVILLGLLVKEVSYTAEITIDKPLKKVFTDFNDDKILKQWMTEIQSIEPLKETPEKVGSQYKMVIQSGKKQIEMLETITAFEQDKRVAFRFDQETMIKLDDFNFEAINDNQTKIVEYSTVQGGNITMRAMSVLLKGMFKKMSLDYLVRFKNVLEK